MTKLRFLVLLIFITGLAYLPFVGNQLFWDDEQFIYNNAYVKSFDVSKLFSTNTIAGAGETSNYYRPLTSLTFAVDYQFWGNNPVGYHLVNTMLHALAASMVFLVLSELGMPIVVAQAIAILFAVHPIQTEAVMYANSRGDSLYSFLGLCSIYSMLQVLHKKTLGVRVYDLVVRIRPSWWGVLSVSTFALSILSKEIGIALAGVHTVLVLHHKVFAGKRTTPQSLITLGTIMGVALTYLVLRFTVLQFQPELNLYGNTAYGTNVIVRLLTFSKIIWQYLLVLVIPYPLHMERTVDVVENLASVWPWLTGLLALGLVQAAVREYRQHHSLWVAFGAGWALIMLAPVSGILPINGMLYEHWLYLPMVGFWILGYGALRAIGIPLEKNSAAAKAAIPIVVVLLLLTWHQNYIWANPIRFYTYTLQFANTARLHNNLAMAYAHEGQLENAISHYKQAIAENDHYPQTHHNLANAYLALGQLADAERSYQAAIAKNEQFSPAYVSLYALYEAQHRTTDAATLKSKFEAVFK